MTLSYCRAIWVCKSRERRVQERTREVVQSQRCHRDMDVIGIRWTAFIVLPNTVSQRRHVRRYTDKLPGGRYRVGTQQAHVQLGPKQLDTLSQYCSQWTVPSDSPSACADVSWASHNGMPLYLKFYHILKVIFLSQLVQRRLQSINMASLEHFSDVFRTNSVYIAGAASICLVILLVSVSGCSTC